MRRPALTALALVLAGCQTLSEVRPKPVPAALRAFFHPCAPTDGAVALRLLTDGHLLGSGELAWIGRTSDQLELELTNAAGQTLLTGAVAGSSIRTSGPLARRLPPLAASDDGFVTVDGDEVRLKTSELGCVLTGAAPQAWLASVTGVALAGKQAAVEFASPDRTMLLTVADLGDPAREERCVHIGWSSYLFFKSHVQWCRKAGRPHETTLSGLGSYVVRWVPLP